jgi:hypothetical protein
VGGGEGIAKGAMTRGLAESSDQVLIKMKLAGPLAKGRPVVTSGERGG